jgi:3'-phosphoadenosine 5'-phosphosulfate sulfotransferase
MMVVAYIFALCVLASIGAVIGSMRARRREMSDFRVVNVTKDRRDSRQKAAAEWIEQVRADQILENEYERKVIENRARASYLRHRDQMKADVVKFRSRRAG